MKCFGLFLAVFALAAVFGVSESAVTTHKPAVKATTRKSVTKLPLSTTTSKPALCTELKNCIPTPGTVWGSDGKTAEAFRNSCYLSNANCERLAQNQTPLKEVSREVAMPLCKQCDYVPGRLDLMCGSYPGEESRIFMSDCDMRYISCLSGKSYVSTYYQECGLESVQNNE